MLWFEGKIHSDPLVPFNLLDRGLLLGDGLFDTSLVVNGRIFQYSAHRARLLVGAERLGFNLEERDICRPMEELAQQACVQGRGSVLRVTVTRGVTPRGLSIPDKIYPVMFGTLFPLSALSFFPSLSLHVSTIHRNETSPASQLKTLAYVDNVLALQEAQQYNCGDALFLNGAGRVACSTISNIFILQGNVLMTPPVTEGAVNGIIRQFILETSPSLGLVPQENLLTLPQIYEADGVFLTNSLRLLAPVRAINGRLLKVSPEWIIKLAHFLLQALESECRRTTKKIPDNDLKRAFQRFAATFQ